jgi:hypothetical protein
MPDVTSAIPERPASAAALLRAIETQRGALYKWAQDGIKALEAQRDRELVQLDDAAALIGRTAEPARSATGSTPRQTRRSRARNPRSKRTTRKIIRERKEAVDRYLGERGQAASAGEIREDLRLTAFMTGQALKSLIEEGRVTRIGESSRTRYLASGNGAKAPVALAEGSSQGRILTLIDDRGYASATELAQATGISLEGVRSECGALIAEGELRMARREGQGVYLRAQAA